MNKQRRSFSPEFKRSAASLVIDQSYSHVDASRSVGVAESVLRRWVQQLQYFQRTTFLLRGYFLAVAQKQIAESVSFGA